MTYYEESRQTAVHIYKAKLDFGTERASVQKLSFFLRLKLYREVPILEKLLTYCKLLTVIKACKYSHAKY